MIRFRGFLREATALATLFAAGLFAGTGAAAAPSQSVAVRNSFRIGDSGVLCTAQTRVADPVLKSMFDRGYAIVCRDAATAVGKLYALRTKAGDPLPALAEKRPAGLACAPSTQEEIKGLGAVSLAICQTGDKLDYRIYSLTRTGTAYIAEGLGGYDSALRLALVSLVTDRATTGEIQVATTSAGDPAAFARVQAGTLDPDNALSEAYLRNNSGSFAESSEFFENLFARDASARTGGGRAGEYLANQALQQSNLGNFPTANALFARAANTSAANEVVGGRLLRNFRAIHLINQELIPAAFEELDRPVKPISMTEGNSDAALGEGVISMGIADQLNRENESLERLGGIDSRLRPYERAQILDAQAMQLRGVAYRLQHNYPEARRSFAAATSALNLVREGRVTSTAWLRSEILSDTALISEAENDLSGAERDLTAALHIFEVEYPASAAYVGAKARLAAFLGRHGQTDRALALYAEVVAASESTPGAAVSLRNQLRPYFALLADRAGTDSQAVTAMFAASQVLQRPGVAQTQAVFARELSGGDDAAAGLFRQSVTLSRDIARATTENARLAGKPDLSAEDRTALDAGRARIAQLEQEQTALQSQLSQYPRYRVLAPQLLALTDLQKLLGEGEAYYKMALVGQDAYAMFVTPTSAQAFRIGASTKALEDEVATLRASIVTLEGGQPTTYPFDVAQARSLFTQLMGPIAEQLGSVTHLIFEPDGPMLQLPANLLVVEQPGVDAYLARVARPNADEFDFRGLAWLGRGRDISTSVSPRSFADVRAIQASKGTLGYLGLGQNARPSAAAITAMPRDACAWPLDTWENPISPTELVLAAGIVGKDRSAVITGADFSDTGLEARSDLNQYRILHFATHGLVTAPRPECPARPALLTSFGGSAASDGLLSFSEIYDLRLDADAVILSACDTAGMATVAATREAGITTGGNYALDGLVRAFVGAGARTVVASHWPVPDDYDATKRLISSLFAATPGTPIATALRAAEVKLMDEAKTSHPYYWSGFAIIGDGRRALMRRDGMASAGERPGL